MKLFTTFTLIAISVFIWACGSGGNGPATSAPTANSTNAAASPQIASSPTASPVDELAAGRDLYTSNCVACHRDDGTGGKVTIEGKTLSVDNLTDEKRKKLTDEKMYRIIYEGIEDEGMPAYRDKLSEAQIREVVRYIRTGLQKMPAADASAAAR